MTALPNDVPWLKAAYGDLGIKETAGKKHNPRIVEMFEKAGHPQVTDDETAWCSAAVNTWMVEGGLKGTRSLAARSWLNWGKPIDKKKTIPRGAVLVFPRGSSSWQGHVGLCVADNGKTLKVLGGNQGNSVSIVPYSRSRLLGARWPNTPTNSRTIAAGVTSAVSGAGAETIDTLQPMFLTAQEQIAPIADYLTIAKYALLAISLAAIGFVIWKHVKRLKGQTRE